MYFGIEEIVAKRSDLFLLLLLLIFQLKCIIRIFGLTIYFSRCFFSADPSTFSSYSQNDPQSKAFVMKTIREKKTQQRWYLEGSTWISINIASHSVHCGIHACIINLFDAFSSLTLVRLSVRSAKFFCGMGDSGCVASGAAAADILRISERCRNSKHILIERWPNPNYAAFPNVDILFFWFVALSVDFRIVRFFAFNWRFQLMTNIIWHNNVLDCLRTYNNSNFISFSQSHLFRKKQTAKK